MAGRVNLAQSVLSPMSYFTMQYAKFPAEVCNNIERIQRDFVWGSSRDNRKLILLGGMCCVCLVILVG